MPNINSYADLVADWEALLKAFDDNGEILAPATPQRDALEQILAQVREIKARQTSHNAIRQRLTQELMEAILAGREQARRLRGMAKGLLGTRNERLVQFQVAPLRSRPRLSTAEPPREATGPEPFETPDDVM